MGGKEKSESSNGNKLGPKELSPDLNIKKIGERPELKIGIDPHQIQVGISIPI